MFLQLCQAVEAIPKNKCPASAGACLVTTKDGKTNYMVSICNINLFQNSTAEGVVVPSRYASQQYQMYLVLVSVCDLYTVKLVIMNSNSLYLVDCLGIFYKNLLFF